jgi:hypothetical protein
MKKHRLALSLIIIVAASAFFVFTHTKRELVLAGPPAENNMNSNGNLAKMELMTSVIAESPQNSNQKRTSITTIDLNGKTIAVNGDGATVSGSKVLISSAGTYSISGTLADGQILVKTGKSASVEIILNGVTINCSNNSPVYIEKARKTKIVLADNSKNRLTDGSVYSANKTKKDEPNAAIFSKDDLTISGNGSLEVTGNYDDGIASKNKLTIESGIILVNSADDGIRGKDSLNIKGGNITVVAKGDGLKSDEKDVAAQDKTPTRDGKITISGGKINITSKGDAIQAASYINIKSGELTLTTGSNAQYVGGSVSLKAISSGDNIVIDGGTFAISSADDAIHSNNTLTINGGTFDIATGNNGILGDSSLVINGGDIRISTSYEGVESSVVKINSGNIHLNSSKNGMSIRSPRKGSGTGGGRWRGFESGNNCLYINGGYIVINANGDGIDSNGAIEMTGGTLLISGPTSNMDGALDFNSFKITGGLLIAAGSSGMAQVPGTGSTQNSVMVYFDTYQAEGTLFRVQTSDGSEIVSFTPQKTYSSVAFSSPKLTIGTAYDVFYGGSSSAKAKDGLYAGGTYSSGTKLISFTPNSVTTFAGSGGMGGGGGFRGGRGRR